MIRSRAITNSGCATTLLFIGLFAAVFPSAVNGQTPAPSFQGKVLDPSNAVIVGAQVTAIPQGQTSGPSTSSDPSGQFALSLSPGRYTIKITANDFMETTASIEITDASLSRDFVLSLPDVRQSVDVKAAAGYQVSTIGSATRTLTPLRDVPQSITVVPQELIRDQGMTSVSDVV